MNLCRLNNDSVKLSNTKLQWILTALIIPFILVGCARSDAPAPVVSLNESNQQSSLYPSDLQNSNSGSVGIVPLQPEQGSGSGMLANSSNNSYQPANSYSNPSNNTVTSTPTVSGIPHRDYNSIPKGSFTGTTYTVQPGDTLFYVAWITGSNVNELANLNGLSYPYALNAGQQLTISNQINPTTYDSQAAYASSSSFHNETEPMGNDINNSTGGKMLSSSSASSGAVMSTGALSKTSAKGFRWPTEGTVILGFSNSDGGSKGIEISGTKGQPIYATKAGKVVYAGNALAGYGNLIIINHNDEYLSAYAHNDTILVAEADTVQGGQQIGTMGSTGTDRVKLYFEIRQQGVSTDPIPFLPSK